MQIRSKLRITGIAVICAAYVMLRLWRFTDSCLWFDEVFSVHAAGLDWGSLFGFVAKDLIHPPFFYVLLKLWTKTGGESLVWLRLFPVLFSTIALFPFYFLCRRLKLSETAIAVALLLLTVNGYLIKYGQEVRMYSVLLCLSLFSYWLFVRFLETGKGLWLLTTVNVLLIHTHYFGGFAIVSEIIAVVVLQRSELRRISVSFVITVASFVPWMIAVFRAAQTDANVTKNLGWASKPGFAEVLRFLFNLNEPFYFQASSVSAFSIFIISLPLLAVIITAFGFFGANWKSQDSERRKEYWLLLLLILIPVLISFVLSWVLPYSVWGTRHFIIVFAPYAILVSKIFDAIEIPVAKRVLAGLGILFISLGFLIHFARRTQSYIWCGWENVAPEIKVSNGQPVSLYTFEEEAAYLLWFAMRERRDVSVLKVDGFKGILEDKAYFLPRGFEGVKRAGPDALAGDRFYIAFRSDAFDLQSPPLDGLVERGFKFKKVKEFNAQRLTVHLIEVTK